MSRRRWDALADAFEENVCDILAHDRRRVIPRLVAAARVPRRGAVLVDLGCGIGTFVRAFGPGFGQVIAADISPRIVARARALCADARDDRLPEVRWIAAGMEAASRRIGPVAHLAVCMNVITSPIARVRDRQWASVAAVTRRGGAALLVLPSLESARHVTAASDARRGRRPRAPSSIAPDGLFDNGGDLQKYWTRREIAAAAAQHGFRDVTIRRVPYPWSDEDVSPPPRMRARLPWDWACLARTIAGRR